MKKKKSKTSASEVLNMLEFLHSGLTWVEDSKMQKTKVGSIEVCFNPKLLQLEFKGPLSFVNLSVPNESTAKRLVSTLQLKLLEVRDTQELLECFQFKPESGVLVESFWGL